MPSKFPEEFFYKYMKAKPLPKNTPPYTFADKQKDWANFQALVSEMSSGIQKPLIEIMSINSANKEQMESQSKVAKRLRETELNQIRQITKVEARDQLVSMTFNLLNDLIKEFDGAFIMSDFVRRAKELRARIGLENKMGKKKA